MAGGELAVGLAGLESPVALVELAELAGKAKVCPPPTMEQWSLGNHSLLLVCPENVQWKSVA